MLRSPQCNSSRDESIRSNLSGFHDFSKTVVPHADGASKLAKISGNLIGVLAMHL